MPIRAHAGITTSPPSLSTWPAATAANGHETRGIQLVHKVLSDDGDADARVAALRGLLPRLPAAVRLFERAASNDSAKAMRDHTLAALRRS